MKHYQVTVLPENVRVTVPEGTNLLTAIVQAGVLLDSACGGRGSCGKCAVRVCAGRVASGADHHLADELARQGYIAACQAQVIEDLSVEVPAFVRLTDANVLLSVPGAGNVGKLDQDPLGKLDPYGQKQVITLEPPELTAVASDFARVSACLGKQAGFGDVRITLAALRQLPLALRQGAWTITATLIATAGGWEIIAVEPGRSVIPAYGIAIDLGTTTVAVQLLNLETGRTVAEAGAYNRQSLYGADVISRIIYSDERPEGLKLLHQALLATVNALIDEVSQASGIAPAAIITAVCAGNTVLSHLFLQIPVTYIRLEPYVPTAQQFPTIKAAAIGLNINPDAPVFLMPAVASYVGGDITAGVLATGLTHSDALTLLIDIGTNGELVLGNSQWLVTCACSAGPAFEGSGIGCGMRAMDGAIEAITISADWQTVDAVTLGGRKPLGICGTGLIDLIAKLLSAGIIDRAGTIQDLQPTSRLRAGSGGREFVLVWAAASGTGSDIAITEADLKNILRAKAAIFAGIMTMLKMVDLEPAAIERIYIAGGFGNYLQIPDAVRIGLLPDLPAAKYTYVGNSSLHGARLGLLHRAARPAAEKIAANMTYLDLSAGNRFMEEFSAALFIPHTDLGLFPSCKMPIPSFLLSP
jgi:uncharacterized 2Fe-2S/4Fe-4S cluster protein (DUF4445 family)